MTKPAATQEAGFRPVIPAMVSADHVIDLAAPDFTHIPWRVLFQSLCVMPRFNGAFGTEPTVGGHSLHVMDVVDEDLKLAALIHDAHENPLGDIVRPVRRMLDRLFCDAYGEVFEEHRVFMPDPLRLLEESLQTALFAKAGLVFPLPPEQMDRLNAADHAVGAHELSLGQHRRLTYDLQKQYRSPDPDVLDTALRTLLARNGTDYGVEA